MSHKKTIGMLVLAVSAVMAAATLILPSMTMDAQAEQCASSASSNTGSASSFSEAFTEGTLVQCDTFSEALPP
jgi:hypothetical protein